MPSSRPAQTPTLALLVFASLLASPLAVAAPPPPRGAHPRIWLGPRALAAMKAGLGTPTSAAAGVVSACKKIAAGQGYITWPEAASTCALAYQLTGDATAAATGLKYWRALIEDDAWDNGQLGNKQGCPAGVTAEQAIRAVAHDTGYPIRFIGPHAALAYDWLHDAPGATDELRGQSRFCFKAWSDYYTSKGYMRSVPGSNYEAGFVFAKSLMAIASAGEDSGAADTMWTEVVDKLFTQDLVASGLGPVAAPPSGILSGGDWVEGWQYGPLSVLEYALATRALEEAGASFPALEAWTDTLVWRYLHATTPTGDGCYVGGDYDDDENVYLPNHPRVLFAVLAGPSSDEAAGFAAGLLPAPPLSDSTPIFPALAEARGAKAAAYPTDRPLSYLASGVRRLYARSAWDKRAFWAAFESAPYLGPDHQHFAASSFVFSRGADHLVVDPSAYGSRSTLTTNAVSVDSDVVLGDYKPSQTPWSLADLPFSRTTTAGTATARSDFAKAFIFADKASDVPFAVRDWSFLPEGEIVTVDRVRTGRADRKTYLRFRTLAKDLALSGGAPWVASGTVGASRLVIHAATLSGGKPVINTVAAGECPSSVKQGACTDARIPVWEYNLTIPGPSALAVHVLDALGTNEEPATVTAISGDQVTGVSVLRAGRLTHVIVSAAQDGAVGPSLGYTAAGGGRHIVFDIPSDSSGHYTVSAVPLGDQCKITLSAGGTPGQTGRPAIFSVADAASGCTVGAEQDVPAIVTPPRPDAGAVPPTEIVTTKDAGVGEDAPSAPTRDAGDIPEAAASQGCRCNLGGTSAPRAVWLFALVGLPVLAGRTWRRHRRSR